MHFLYNIGIRLYVLAIRLISPFNAKAKLWLSGRKHSFSELEKWRKENPGEVLWMHCASLGEFEQGRSILEAIRKKYPSRKILLSFFSPSGYEVRKNYSGADFICYLPADTPKNARRFIQIMKPKAAFIVKYEYWANYFFECKEKDVPLLVVSGILRNDQRFFGAFSSFWKKVLSCVTHFFVQNDETKQLLNGIEFSNVTVAGDSRFDRVIEIASTAKSFDEIEKFKGDSFCVVVGSSWPQEEKMLSGWIQNQSDKNAKLILVPHEISESHIRSILDLYPNAVRWTHLQTADLSKVQILIIDTIGMLSSVYRYADIAIIGGGFGKGIHNTLEAAVWNIPVLFGPKYHKFDEALQLIACGGAFVFQNEKELTERLSEMEQQAQLRIEAGSKAGDFVRQSKGATAAILAFLEETIFTEK